MAATPGRKYLFHDAEVDTGRMVVRVGSEERSLRPKTFQLLTYLIEQRRRLVPKQELFEHLWPEATVADGSLTQCITEIRKAFEEDPRNPRLIRTVARVGYQFIGEVREYCDQADTRLPQVAAEAPSPARWPRGIVLAAALALAICAAVMLLARHTPVSTGYSADSGEIAYWALDEGSGTTVRDAVHGLSATIPPGAQWTQGICGRALLFTGGEAIRGEDPERVLPRGLNPRTIIAWVKAPPTNGDAVPIFAVGDLAPDSPAGSTFGLAIHESGVAGFGTGHRYATSTRRIDDGHWHQVAGVLGADQRLTVFVDGAQEASTVVPGLRAASKSRWLIGTGFAYNNVHGAVDDARVYGRALGPAEIRSLYECVASGPDIEVQGLSKVYFAPVFGNNVAIEPRGAGGVSASIIHTGKDFAGITLVERPPDCSLRSLHSADIGQDVNIALDLLVPSGSNGATTAGGPFFRSRSAYAGDGIVGGTSAGYWVHLDSTGRVRVQSLLPNATVAISDQPPRFDPSVLHHVETAAHGNELEVAVDGRVVEFAVGQERRRVVPIPALWETVSPRATNNGAAGIAFHAAANRGQAGGQIARNIRVTSYRPLR